MTGTDEAGPPARRPSLRRLPDLALRAVRLVWKAARGELLAYVALQTSSAAGIGVQLLLGRRVLAVVVAGSTAHRSLGDVAPELLGLAAVTAALGFAGAALAERRQILSELVERHVQGQIIDAVSDVDLAAFEDATFHDRLRRARVNAATRSWEVTYALVTLSSGLTGLVALGAVLTGIEPLVLPLVLVSYVPLALATGRNSRASYEFAYEMTAADRERTYLSEVLTGKAEAKEIRLFDLSAFLRRRYDDLYARRIAELRRVVRRRLRRALLATGGNSIVTIVALGALLQLTLSGRISPADAGVAAVALQQLAYRLRAINSSTASLHECSLFLDDLISFLDLRTTIQAERPTGPAPASFRRLALDDVSFVYPGTTRAVLSGVSLEIGGGDIVALVGRNGSGKTTLAKILCGLYQPTSGRILWDGTDVAGADPAELRRGITAIFQDFVHYDLPARDNIALGDHRRADDMAAVHRAAALAGVDRLLSGLPDGYGTRLSRSYAGGTELSIGQWQRVALARAFFRDAPFLVLDEPTAALDAEAEYELFERIRALQQGRAVLLISHRFSSVRSADRIYVLEKGAVAESGSHAELMARQGRYAEMFTLQASAYLDEVE